ncbi:hypothetical protein SARC_13961 [Sphaeroforma arctica JP610]|uniref:Uncharacterized protein n=1 Tax=Sphaeroforma arctica JP610 TaxID=667725 RepID=A0A0L0FAC6_9EUKA|nr:hypothetical protein SARC_13961 [Sphaeroforma arctica JP610]KNC73481.1 hypothetical protein SARC_13961 [Sphaeroforma arctica JP610]|eukprot:XP_014147383.1 hypothetical protein SARC_13961 [Sphaeroforma arctica JP610]
MQLLQQAQPKNVMLVHDGHGVICLGQMLWCHMSTQDVMVSYVYAKCCGGTFQCQLIPTWPLNTNWITHTPPVPNISRFVFSLPVPNKSKSGEKKKMAFLKDKIVAQFGVPCYFPQNGETVTITSVPPIPIGLEVSLVKRQLEMSELTSSQVRVNKV